MRHHHLLLLLILIPSPDAALPSVSAYDDEDQMLAFVKSKLKEIAKKKGIADLAMHEQLEEQHGVIIMWNGEGFILFLMNESNCTEHHQKMEIFALVIS